MVEAAPGKIVHVLSGAAYDLYVGRAMPHHGLAASQWANPYKVGRDVDLAAVLARFEEHVSYLCRDSITGVDMSHGVRRTPHSIRKVQLAELRGLTLACWCPPKDGTSLTLAEREVCHGQVLLRLATAAAEELAS